MGSPVLFGGNNTSNGLQNAFLMANGMNLTSDGPKNYITYGTFENNTTTGWSLGTIGTRTNGLPTGTPTFGSGASANLSISTVSSGQLDGTYSLSLASSAATTAGNMLATQAYTIATADQAKCLSFRFAYSTPTNPSNVNFSGTSSNSWAVAVYDVTNSVWLPVNGAFAFTQGTGVGIATGVFQTGATTASIRLCIYAANATAGASTMYLDDFYVGPQQVQYGSFMSDPQSWGTLTISTGTHSLTNGSYWREGKFLCGRLYWSTSAGGSGLWNITLPASLSIDTTYVSLSTLTNGIGNQTVGTVMGTAVYDAASNVAVTYGSGAVVATAATTLAVVFTGAASSALNASGNAFLDRGAGLGSAFANVTTSTTSLEFRVPIAGWSSNQILSSDSAQNVVALIADTSTTVATANTTNINFTNVLKDTNAGYSAGVYTCPVSGFYWIFGETYSTTGHTAYIYVNAANVAQGTPFSSSAMASSVEALRFLNAGDTVAIRVDQNCTLAGGAPLNRFNIFRISGPAQLATTPECVANYYLSTNTAVGSSAVVKFDTKIKDTFNAYSTSTGLFTAPFTASFYISFVGYSTSSTNALTIYKNGSDTQLLCSLPAINTGYSGSTIMNLNAGDTIGIYCTGAMTLAGNSTRDRSAIAIARIG